MPLANASTEVPARKTISEVASMLVDHGAAAVTVRRDTSGQPNGLGFVLRTPAGDREFELPARADNVRRVLLRQQFRPGMTTPEHAQNVAWRIVKDWLRAQLALVESGQVDMAEVMLPFLLLESADGPRTLYQQFSADRALPAASSR